MECFRCNKRFKSKQNLQYHLDKKIKCDTIYECERCKTRFITKYNLDKHIKSNKCVSMPIEDELKLTKIELANCKQELLDCKLNQNIENTYHTKVIELNKELNETFEISENIQIEIQHNELKLIPLFDKTINHKVLNKININDIITTYKKLLSIMDLLYIINYDLNKLYVDKFWNNIESDDWIYLDEELIQWFGHNSLSKGKEKIVNLLKKYHKYDDEYKILNCEEYHNSITIDNSFCSPRGGEQNIKGNNRGGSNKNYIFMNSDCFKNICMLINTDKAKDIRQYFIEVEKIFKFYLKYTYEYNKHELEKTKLIKNRYINKSKLIFNSKLYLITTLMMAKENIFKFGSTINEKARKVAYNTGHVDGDKFFYVAIYDCYDASYLEKYIARLLINFKIPNESEMYQLHFKALDSIIKLAIDNNNNTLENINNMIVNEYDKYLDLEPFVFKELNLI